MGFRKLGFVYDLDFGTWDLATLIKNYKFQIYNSEKGITLVELIVVICIITLFTAILISNFPKMLRQFALSRAAYQLAQDLRKTQDLGLSGVQLNDVNNNSIAVKGYGIYIDPLNPTQYLIYADVADVNGSFDQEYDASPPPPFCSSVDQINGGTLEADCIVEIVDLTKEDPSLSIKGLANIASGESTSINYAPPNPITKISNIVSASFPIGIILQNTDGNTRTVYAGISGLISVQ